MSDQLTIDIMTVDEIKGYCCDDMWVVSTLAKQLLATMQREAKLLTALEAAYVHLSMHPTKAKGWNYVLNIAEQALNECRCE